MEMFAQRYLSNGPALVLAGPTLLRVGLVWGSFQKDAACLMERKEAIFIPLSIHVPSAVADNI